MRQGTQYNPECAKESPEVSAEYRRGGDAFLRGVIIMGDLDNKTASPPISRESVESLLEVARQKHPICGRDIPHVVHPGVRGWTICSNCFALLWIGGKVEE